MPAIRPMQLAPPESDDFEPRVLLRMFSKGRKIFRPRLRNRPSALGNAYAGTKARGGGNIRGGTYNR